MNAKKTIQGSVAISLFISAIMIFYYPSDYNQTAKSKIETDLFSYNNEDDLCDPFEWCYETDGNSLNAKEGNIAEKEQTLNPSKPKTDKPFSKSEIVKSKEEQNVEEVKVNTQSSSSLNKEVVFVNSEPVIQEDKSGLENYFRKNQQPDQSFTFNAAEEHTFTAKEGTKLTIPENAFVDADGNKIEGKVEFKLKEFYGLHKALTANLTTTSGNEILESNGMLYMEANANGKPLSLAKNKAIKMQFSEDLMKMGTKLFTGNWSNNQTAVGENNDAILSNTVDWVPQDSIRPEDETAYRALVEANNGFPIDKNILRFPGGIDGFQQSFVNFGEYPDEALERGQTGVVIMDIKIEGDGSLSKVEALHGNPLFVEATVNALNNFPDWISHFRSGDAVATHLTFPVRYQLGLDLNADGSFPFQTYRRNEFIVSDQYRFICKNADLCFENQCFKDANDFFVSSTSMGWVNLDIFRKYEGERKDLLVNLKFEDITVQYMAVYMVLDNGNSIMRGMKKGDKVYFLDVPANIEVAFVSIGVLHQAVYLDAIRYNVSSAKGMPSLFPEIKSTQQVKYILDQLELGRVI